jgi:TonB family protein
MRSHHGIIVVLAGVASLLLHAAVLSSFRSVKVGGGNHAAEAFEEMTIDLVPPESVHEPERPEPRPKLREFDIGEVGANGYASHRTEGDRTAVAREAPVDQAALSLDPVGTEPRPEQPSQEPRDEAAPAAPTLVVLAPPPSAPADASPRVDVIEPPPDAPLPSAPATPAPPVPAPSAPAIEPPFAVAVGDGAPPRPTAFLRPAPPAPTAAAPSAPAARGASPPSPGSGADPAPMSDSESDAFSVLGSARFVNGELRVRAGRKVRSRRPKIGVAGQFDAIYARLEVTLRVAVDKTGKVTAVDVAKSSGSNEIDQPCRVSMYDWWFEPKKDKAGVAVPDVFLFTIGFQ